MPLFIVDRTVTTRTRVAVSAATPEEAKAAAAKGQGTELEKPAITSSAGTVRLAPGETIDHATVAKKRAAALNRKLSVARKAS